MAEFRRMLFLVNAAAGLLSVSGAEITVKYVCPGDSVQAFQNIDFYRCNALVSLHITDTRGKEIARWLWQNGTLNVTRIEEEYTDRVFLDQNGTITIHNFHPFDKGNYLLICKNDTDTRESIKEVKINVMVAPSNDCKPMIERSGNKLFARLKDGDCGIPVATPYWKGDGGVSDTNEAMLQITPGNESRTYYACIQGPALQCVKSQMSPEYCSPFIIEGNTSRTMSSESYSSTGFIEVVIVLAILLSLALVAIVILILILKRRRRDLKEWQRYKELKQSAEMQDLLPIPIPKTQPSTVIESDDPKPMTEQAFTMHQLSHNSNLMREKGPDSGRCAICGQKNSAMFVLTCEHLGSWYIPTCIKCGIFRGPCEQSMKSKRKSMEFATWTVLTDSAQN